MSEQTVAVVVGAGGDIGGACARRARHLADVVLCVDRDPDRVSAALTHDSGPGGRGVALAADAGDEDFGVAVADAAARLGTVVAAVHAVAFEEHRPAAELSPDSLRRSFAVGPLAAFALFQGLRASGCLARGAALTVIGSLHAGVPFARTLGYNAAHAALEQVVKTLAHEWAADGVRVNAVAPGWIRTRGEAELYGEEHLGLVASALPFGRFGTPEDVADAVEFLWSDRAAYISGTTLTVDGALAVSLARLPSPDKRAGG